MEGQSSDTGVVPSEDVSSCVIGWCSKNLETNNKLQRMITENEGAVKMSTCFPGKQLLHDTHFCPSPPH